MEGIRILPEILSNQIAAGEVVERPAAVVKELVENSLDAGATRIEIDIQNGGKSLIRVSDNGRGMSRDDALLSIERYATSKIHTTDDLFAISTMGFRGEALPSIASVSKMTLVTKNSASPVATRIDIAGGKLVNVADAGAPEGTMVEIRQLFYNTPARRKFLKAVSTENSHVADTIQGIALGHPLIQFALSTGGQLQRNYAASEDSFSRAVHVLGKEVRRKLYPVSHAGEGLSIEGFVSHPSVTRSTGSRIYLYANRRLIRDRGLVSAVFKGYAGRIMKHRFPHVVLFVETDPDQVDVNVHPTKREVKFADPSRIYQALSEAVSTALASAEKTDRRYTVVPDEKKSGNDFRPGHTIQKPFSSGVHSSGVQMIPAPWEPVPPDPLETEPVAAPLETTVKTVALGNCHVIGQVMGSYIVAENPDGLMLIDQHAAHERIVYEKLKKRYHSLKLVSQDLLVPETIEPGAREADLLARNLDHLAGMGICIEPFGGTTFVIKSLPDIISHKDAGALVLEILDRLLEYNDTTPQADWLEDCLAAMACHDAIRAGQALNQSQMTQLLLDLSDCENAMHCPHGRPTVISWNKSKIEKLFKRVV